MVLQSTYALLKRVSSENVEDDLAKGEERSVVVLECRFSWFADDTGKNDWLRYLGIVLGVRLFMYFTYFGTAPTRESCVSRSMFGGTLIESQRYYSRLK